MKGAKAGSIRGQLLFSLELGTEVVTQCLTSSDESKLFVLWNRAGGNKKRVSKRVARGAAATKERKNTL